MTVKITVALRYVASSILLAALFAACSGFPGTDLFPRSKPAPSAVDSAESEPDGSVPLADSVFYRSTSADDFPVEEFTAAGDTVFYDENGYEDANGIDPYRVFDHVQERKRSAQAHMLKARADIDSALALIDKIPPGHPDPEAQARRDEAVIELSRLVRQLAMFENREGISREGEIPLELNEHVLREIASFQGRERAFFLASYQRAGAYYPMMTQKLREAGMPESIIWLALIESGFKTSAFSRARALGPWQFIASTGNRYGLTRDQWRDERRDFERSTDAAIAYLTDLHAMFGDWNTALAAYNSGEGRVLRIINRQSANHLDQFWDLYVQLPAETRRYVPRFHAVLHIIQDPEKWGFNDLPEQLEPIEFDTLVVDRQLRLADIASRLGVPDDELEFLNPALRMKITPDFAYTIRVPKGMGEQAKEVIASVPESKLPEVPQFVTHRVRYGENLSTIARRYRTSVRAIQNANNMRGTLIRSGQTLRIPVHNPTYTASRPAVAQAAIQTPDGATVHVVRRGDTLWDIAQAHGVTVAQIRRLNGLGNSSRIYPGQRLVVKTN